MEKPSLSDVSIVVPVYNGVDYIEALVENLDFYYQQGCELIFVEDGSDQPIKDVVLSRFPTCHYVWQENKGAAAARNKGVGLAHGQYIQLMDVDDTISQDKIQIQLEWAVRAGADVVYSDWRNLYIDPVSSEKSVEPWQIEKNYEDIILESLKGWWTPTPCPLIHKKAYLDVRGMNEQLKVGEDTCFFHELAIRGYKFDYCPGNFFTYHSHGDRRSLSTNNQTHYPAATLKIAQKDRSLLLKLDKMKPEYNQATLDLMFQAARSILAENWEKGLEIERDIREINRHFLPSTQTTLYRCFYFVFGFRITEKLSASIYRILK